MVFRFGSLLRFGRRDTTVSRKNIPYRQSVKTVNHDAPEAKRRPTSKWKKILTASLRDNCLAPADEVILLSFERFLDDWHEPGRERQRKMAGQMAKVVDGFAQVQALAPDLVERARAKHRLDIDRISRHGGL
ncbi:MAG: hypothetical protein AAFV74_19760 [Pseudomonadota bacterium]